MSTAHGSVAAAVDQGERRVLGAVAGRVEGVDADLAERELPAVVEGLVLVLGARVAVHVDGRAGRGAEAGVPGDVVGVGVGLEDVVDRDPEEAREAQVLVDLDSGRRRRRRPRARHRRGRTRSRGRRG